MVAVKLFLVHVKQTVRQHYSVEWHRSQLPVTYTTLTQSVLGLSLHNINTKPSHPEPREPCPTTTDLPPLATESLRLRLLTATSGPPTTTTQLLYISTEVATFQHHDDKLVRSSIYSSISTIFQATRMTSISWSSLERQPSLSSSSSLWLRFSTWLSTAVFQFPPEINRIQVAFSRLILGKKCFSCLIFDISGSSNFPN